MPVDPVSAMSLSARQLSKHFTQAGGVRQSVLADCSFDIEPGRLTVLMGPSGCGKSTLAYLLAGYLAPDAGSLTIDGEPITKAGPDRLLVFQETALWPWMSVIENVMFGPLCAKKMSRPQARQAALALLQRFGLSDFADRYPNQLSGGMKRRAELAQALINSPKLMILDEPFRGLDVMTRELMQAYLMRLFEQTQLTTLFITSELEEAIFLADRILFMSASPGRIVRTLEIDLPHPRTFETMTSDRYLQIKKDSLATLIEHGAVSLE
jgi:NitT/TauT family transport system ATP-binding protein